MKFFSHSNFTDTIFRCWNFTSVFCIF